MRRYETIITNFRNITGEEAGMVNSIERGVLNGIINRLPYHFHSDYFFCQPANKNANAASAAIQVINCFVSTQFCKFSCCMVKFFGLVGICLKKRLWADFEPEILERFNYVAVTRVC